MRSRWTREKRRNTLEVLEDNWNKEEQTGLRRTGANAASMQFQEAEESRAREEPTMRLVEQNQALCALSAAASSFNLVIISLIIYQHEGLTLCNSHCCVAWGRLYLSPPQLAFLMAIA